jgi:hypothetical protein
MSSSPTRLSSLVASHQNLLNNWPEPSLPEGQVGTRHKLFGAKDENPDNSLSQDPLDWKVLKTLTGEERKKQIIARANYFTQIYPPHYVLGVTVISKIDEARAEGKFSLEKPLQPLAMDKK